MNRDRMPMELMERRWSECKTDCDWVYNEDTAHECGALFETVLRTKDSNGEALRSWKLVNWEKFKHNFVAEASERSKQFGGETRNVLKGLLGEMTGRLFVRPETIITSQFPLMLTFPREDLTPCCDIESSEAKTVYKIEIKTTPNIWIPKTRSGSPWHRPRCHYLLFDVIGWVVSPVGWLPVEELICGKGFIDEGDHWIVRRENLQPFSGFLWRNWRAPIWPYPLPSATWGET